MYSKDFYTQSEWTLKIFIPILKFIKPTVKAQILGFACGLLMDNDWGNCYQGQYWVKAD